MRYDIVEKKLIDIISRDMEEVNRTYVICLEHFLLANANTIVKIICLILSETGEEDDDDEEKYNYYLIHNLCYNPEDGEFVEFECDCDN